MLGAVGVLFASTHPDGIERLTRYDALGAHSAWWNKTAAGLGGLALVYAACFVLGRVAARRGPRAAPAPEPAGLDCGGD
jgi:hypothetical protein